MIGHVSYRAMPDSFENEAPARDPDMPDDALGLGLLAADEVAPAAAQGGVYRVLARKYRPQTFAELIGQDAMVQTLGNAIKRGRLAHAFLMTGVRGVGKTSTARLIAKALNCTGLDGQGGATIDPCGKCEPCVAIAEGRHIDVIEMDAASHTGVDDVREIIEAVRYAAVSARYKIYIIDEVHMLSKNAFNALLKTLEEPPAHVKFLFATTEVNKVPITVLSRCQRFDLKRILESTLADHFAEILIKENVVAEPEALRLIAQAAEGSVRDGLSILDQAIAHADMDGDGKVTAAQVRDMLGLSDKGAVRRLLALLLSGDAKGTLSEARGQYRLGVEPGAMLAGLLKEVHRITLTKIGAPQDAALDGAAIEAVNDTADKLSFPMLHRLWQLMLKGHEEVSRAAMPLEASDMALLRIVHGASMPDPGELARLITQHGVMDAAASSGPSNAGTTTSAPAVTDAIITQPVLPDNFLALLDMLAAKGHVRVEAELRDVMRIVTYAPPAISYQLGGKVTPSFASDVRDALYDATGARWDLTESADQEAAPTLREMEMEKEASIMQEVLDSPMVKAALAAFPEAELLKDTELDEQRSKIA
jgi:DNA polymerase III subunit gamma/tau